MYAMDNAIESRTIPPPLPSEYDGNFSFVEDADAGEQDSVLLFA